MNTLDDKNTIFPKGEKASSDYFTGTAWVNIMVPRSWHQLLQTRLFC
jgi:4-carboxymuconolactone decarboxylase